MVEESSGDPSVSEDPHLVLRAYVEEEIKRLDYEIARVYVERDRLQYFLNTLSR